MRGINEKGNDEQGEQKREIKNRKRGRKGREERKIDRGREEKTEMNVSTCPDKWPILFIFNDGYNCKLTNIK